ncbi:hypothetical protein [Spongiactinospora sp. TRM90649]|uniref:hypothetical protein n=1 Tax=Spongiactinospora sp. TRM90649 TaxID=3031114 RepID=UPI0023F86CFD|nr:hypothetical protein [Spongiactinospora sp. TRM90649]MDF5759196.1 hypothetical protein [Spongiactinospora sp. TRM90649]
MGGSDDPQDTPKPPPTEPPPVWEDRRWADPRFAGICRYCLGSGKVSHLDTATRTLVTVACRCAGERESA